MTRGWKIGLLSTFVLAVVGAVVIAPLFRLPVEFDPSELEEEDEWVGA